MSAPSKVLSSFLVLNPAHIAQNTLKDCPIVLSSLPGFRIPKLPSSSPCADSVLKLSLLGADISCPGSSLVVILTSLPPLDIFCKPHHCWCVNNIIDGCVFFCQGRPATLVSLPIIDSFALYSTSFLMGEVGHATL